MNVDVAVSTPISRSMRARQLEAMFDVPGGDIQMRMWAGDVPLDERDWNVGLIVGPSGAGKTTIARQMFGDELVPEWHEPSVIDDFDESISMQEIANACQAVGFNTIPAWLRPFEVLSTGERFRVDLARRMLESAPDEPLVVDEFSSVVDRQVAKIGAHAVQKWVRRADRQFVAVTCHWDVVEWLRPDWVLEPSTMTFRWESLRPRPPIDVSIERVPFSAWQMFAPFHYLTQSLHRAARCFVLFVDEQPASFVGILHRPHSRTHGRPIKGISRVVTLPDWQGLGLAFVLMDALGAAYKRDGIRLHNYPAHPALIHAHDRSEMWEMRSPPRGALGRHGGATSSVGGQRELERRRTELGSRGATWRFGRRPNAVFEYVGPAAESNEWLHADLEREPIAA